MDNALWYVGGAVEYMISGCLLTVVCYLYAQMGKEQHCAIMLTEMRDNTPLLDFYIAKGAEDLKVTERRHFLHFDRDALDRLAQEALQYTWKSIVQRSFFNERK